MQASYVQHAAAAAGVVAWRASNVLSSQALAICRHSQPARALWVQHGLFELVQVALQGDAAVRCLVLNIVVYKGCSVPGITWRA